MKDRIATQDRKWSREEVLKLLKAQKFRCYINSGMNDSVVTTPLVEIE